MSLIWDAMSWGRTKGEDESPPESRRTNGDIKSLLRPGTRATGVLCSPLPPVPSFPSTCPRFLDTFCTGHVRKSRQCSRFLRRFQRDPLPPPPCPDRDISPCYLHLGIVGAAHGNWAISRNALNYSMGSLSTLKRILILKGEIVAKLRKGLTESCGVSSTACLIYIEMEGARGVCPPDTPAAISIAIEFRRKGGSAATSPLIYKLSLLS